MFKRILSILFVTILAISLPGFTSFAKADSLTKSIVKNENSIRSNFKQLGIDNNTQDKLIKKLKSGEMIDSMNPYKLQEALENSPKIPLGKSRTYTFEDGS